MAWLGRRSPRGLAAWVGVCGLAAFIATFVGVVIPSNSANVLEWLPDKVAALRTYVAINAWSLVAAEIHRIVSLLLAIVCFTCVLRSIVYRQDPGLRSNLGDD